MDSGFISTKVKAPQGSDLISQAPTSCQSISELAQYVTKGGVIYIDPVSSNVWHGRNCVHIGSLNSYMYVDNSFKECDPKLASPNTGLWGLMNELSVSPLKCNQVIYTLKDKVLNNISYQEVYMVGRDARAVVAAQSNGQQEPGWITQLVGMSKHMCKHFDCSVLGY